VLEQNHAVNYAFSVREVVGLGRYAYSSGIFAGRSDADDDAVERALALTGLEVLADKSVLKLSGGELQRVFLAQIFAQDPDLLYRLYDQWEIFRWERDGLYRMMNEKYGTQAQAKERYLLQTNFILQDCFYEEDGYGYVMTGCGLPMIDAGAACFVGDWCWYPYGFTTFVARDKILTPNGKTEAHR